MPRGPHQLPGDTRPSSAPVPSHSEFAPGLRKLKRPYPIILSSNKNSSPPSSLRGGGREDLGRKKESPSLSSKLPCKWFLWRIALATVPRQQSQEGQRDACCARWQLCSRQGLPPLQVMEPYPAKDLTRAKQPILTVQFERANVFSCLHPGIKETLIDKGQELSRRIKIHLISCFSSCTECFRNFACDL